MGPQEVTAITEGTFWTSSLDTALDKMPACSYGIHKGQYRLRRERDRKVERD